MVKNPSESGQSKLDIVAQKKRSRRGFIKGISASAGIGASLVGTDAQAFLTEDQKERLSLTWEEYFRTNYRYMSKREKRKTKGT
jgi:molybdopterin-containing oxidoreductase family iron-sulfur binding subunit